jgi:hypothetical protein
MSAAVLDAPTRAPTPAAWSATSWKGVVAVQRPQWSGPDAPCRVFSARAIEFNGRRAVLVDVPYSMVAHYFDSDDDETVYVEAEVIDQHLQLHGKSNFKEWAYFSASRN